MRVFHVLVCAYPSSLQISSGVILRRCISPAMFPATMSIGNSRGFDLVSCHLSFLLSLSRTNAVFHSQFLDDCHIDFNQLLVLCDDVNPCQLVPFRFANALASHPIPLVGQTGIQGNVCSGFDGTIDFLVN